jgi:hydroxymethylglutaryl-CoA synthase
MIISNSAGIRSYGVYLPEWAIPLKEIERAQNKKESSVSRSLKVKQKTVPDLDEDTITISTQAARQAISRAAASDNFDRQNLGCLFIGSESHPYAVKPSGTVVKQALELSEEMALADLQFACKAGTQALQIGLSYVLSGLAHSALAIGADTAQAEPGDALEYTAAAGGAAFVLDNSDLIAQLKGTLSIASDTPDFWRRAGQPYPQHGGRFTGQPAYFKHVMKATNSLMAELELKPKEVDHCIFHTPNGKFPRRVAKKLGFSQDQLKASLVVDKIGNTYAGASMLALAAVLDQAKAKQTILVTSYGSGAGADSFVFETTDLLETKRQKWQKLVREQINRLKPITYQEYQQKMKHRSH